MTETTPKDWYGLQAQRDQGSKALSESLLGPEKLLFAEAMGLVLSCLDAVFACEQQINDLVIKRKISVVHHAFNLLCSAWGETLAGRYSAAADHFRSIEESPDFLYALDINPQLADERTIKIETARRTIRDELARLDKGQAHERLAEMQKAAKKIEPFSHISVKSLGGSLPVSEKVGKKAAVVRLGGAVSEFTLRILATQLALSALSLLVAVVFSFRGIVEVDELLWKGLVDRGEQWISRLGKELDALGDRSAGAVEAVYFARFDEEV